TRAALFVGRQRFTSRRRTNRPVLWHWLASDKTSPDGPGTPPGRTHPRSLQNNLITNGRRLSEPAGPSLFAGRGPPQRAHHQQPSTRRGRPPWRPAPPRARRGPLAGRTRVAGLVAASPGRKRGPPRRWDEKRRGGLHPAGRVTSPEECRGGIPGI